MLQHSDPLIQSLFDDITEQRDTAMVKVANLRVLATKQQDEIESLKAENERLKSGLNIVIEDTPETANQPTED